MEQRFLALGGAAGIDAAISDFFGILVNMAVAFGASFRHNNFASRLPFLNHLDHVRNHFSSALDDHGVANMQDEARNFTHVVQGGGGHEDAPTRHRSDT